MTPAAPRHRYLWRLVAWALLAVGLVGVVHPGPLSQHLLFAGLVLAFLGWEFRRVVVRQPLHLVAVATAAVLAVPLVKGILATGILTALAGGVAALPLHQLLPWLPVWAPPLLGLAAVPANAAFWAWRGHPLRATTTAVAPLLVTLRAHEWLLPLLGVVLGVLLALAALWAVWPHAAHSRARMRRFKRRWPRKIAACGMAGARLDGMERLQDGYLWKVWVRLPEGKSASDLKRAAERIEPTFGFRTDSVRVFASPVHSGRPFLLISHAEAFQKPIPMPSTLAPNIRVPVELGVDEHGRVVRLRMFGDGGATHVLISGVTGSGKSTVLEVLLRNLLEMPGVRVSVANPKITGFAFAKGKLAHLATEPKDIEQLLANMVRALAHRGHWLDEHGLDLWPTGPGSEPVLVLVVDELADLTDDAKRDLDEIVRKGRALGVLAICATQRPSAQALGELGGNLRSQFGATIGLGVKRHEEARITFGEDATRAGWDPQKLHVKGTFLLRDDEHTEPVIARSFWPGKQDDGKAEGLGEKSGPTRGRARARADRWRVRQVRHNALRLVRQVRRRGWRVMQRPILRRLARVQRRLPRRLAILLAHVTTGRWYGKGPLPNGLKPPKGKRQKAS